MEDDDLGDDGGMTVEKCQDLIEKSLTTPKVKTLLEGLKKRRCPNSIKAVNCETTYAGIYGKQVGVQICSNNMCCDRAVERTVIHELIHAYDDCRGAKSNSSDIHNLACTEIRAYNLSHDCDCKPDCVKQGAIYSVTQLQFSEAEAKSAVEVMWDTCYNDTTPFDQPS